MTNVVRCAVAAMVVGLWSANAFAQSETQLATRRVLLDQAQQAHDAGNHARALEIAEQAGRIQMSPSLRLFIAQEERTLGRMAAALGSADSCTREASRDTGNRNRDEIVAACRQLVAELRHAVGSVTISVSPSVPSGLRVMVAGDALDASALGLPYVVTAGHVAIDASAPGYAAVHREVDVASGAVVDVPIAFTTAPGSTSATPATTEVASPAPASTNTVPATVPTASRETPPTETITHWPAAGFVVAGVGLAGFIASGVFFALRAESISGCNESMGTLVCPLSARDRVEAGYGPFTVATDVSLAIGAAGVVAGAAWLLFGRTHERRQTHVVFDVSPFGAGLAVRGEL